MRKSHFILALILIIAVFKANANTPVNIMWNQVRTLIPQVLGAPIAPGTGASGCLKFEDGSSYPVGTLDHTQYFDKKYEKDSPSTHGMLLFGKKTFFISHLPMFHSPHNYQAIMEVEMDEAAAKIYSASGGGGSSSIFTIVPDEMVLPEVIQKKGTISASLVRGHFERGGKEIVPRVSLKIKRVVYFKQFDEKSPDVSGKKYVMFGNEGEQYIANVINRKPGKGEPGAYDHIASFSAPPFFKSKLAHLPHLPLTPDSKMPTGTKPTKPAEQKFRLGFEGSKDTLKGSVLDIYRETGDLEM